MPSPLPVPSSLYGPLPSLFGVACLLLVAVAMTAIPRAAGAQEDPEQQFEGQIIRRITIEGLTRTPEAELLAQLKVRLRQRFSTEDLRLEIGRLYQTGKFFEILPTKVEAFEDGVWVRIRVQEKPRVRQLKFVAVDTESQEPSVSTSSIEEAISTQLRGELTLFTLKLDAESIAQIYQDEGYVFVEVNSSVEDVRGGVSVSFRIKEGPRVRIQTIHFEGNRNVPSGTLKSLILTKEKDWFFGLINPGYYDREELEQDLDKIEQYHRSLGFFDVHAAVTRLEFYDLNRKLDIYIHIEQGPRFTFEGYDFSGNVIFPDSVLRQLVNAKPGVHFSSESVEQDRKKVLAYYQDRAHVDSRVDPKPSYSEEGEKVRIRFDIVEGHEVTIEQVQIQGNFQTQDRVIRRELEFYPGEKVSGSKLEKSRSNLARLAIFREIDFDFSPGSDKDLRDVIVRVEEQPTGRLMIGFGLTSGFGVIGNFAIQKQNFDITDYPESIYDIADSFTGSGQTMNIALQPGTQRSLYTFSFTEPYLFETRNALTIGGRAVTILRRDYDEGRIGFTPRIAHAFDFDRDLVLSVGLRLEEVEIDDIEFDAPPDAFEAEGKTSIVATNVTLLYNKVLYEPLEGPYGGHQEEISFEYGGEPLGGQIDFTKSDGALRLYYPIHVQEDEGLHHVLSLHSRAGLIEGRKDTSDIPIFERFFLGGPNTVRGFRFRGLGPHVNRDAVGGTVRWYGNAEYTFPLFQKFLRGVTWFDYGVLERDSEDINLERMRLAAGLGIRVNFPLLGTPLPIALYFGKALRKEEEDRTRSFLFTIGAPF